MKKTLMFMAGVLLAVTTLTSCGLNRIEPNYEGVLVKNWGRDGINDFHLVTGAQGILWWGQTLYRVPMFETSGDPTAIEITTKDGGVYTVDPLYNYEPLRGQGKNIVYHYKQVGLDDEKTAMDHIEATILNQRVIDAYREEARNYTNDSLLNHMQSFEKAVERDLRDTFAVKYFNLKNITSGLKPPASMAQAIERRNNAVTQAEQVKNELVVEKMQLEKAEIRRQRDLVQSAGLTPQILQQQWIEAIKGTDKLIITDGKTPLMITR